MGVPCIMVEYEGQMQRLVDLSKRFGIQHATAVARWRKGWTGDALFSSPKESHSRICRICGSKFLTPPTSNKSTCGKACAQAFRDWKKAQPKVTNTRLYNIWCGMKSRCNGSKSVLCTKYYQERGIKVCVEWQTFAPFMNWALSNGYDDNLSIDRINNDLGYEPANCRWATRVQQMANTRKRCDAKTSRFKWVSKHSQNDSWIAQGYANGKPINLGSFRNEVDAALAYDRWAIQKYGEYANPNIKGGASC